MCGGLDHPQPAAPSSDAVTEADERAARALFDSAELSVEPAREAVALAASVVTELRARAGDGLPDLTVEAELARLEALAAGLPLRAAELEQSSADLDRAATRVTETEAALTESRTALAGLSGRDRRTARPGHGGA